MVKCMCKLCHKEFEGTYKVKFMPIDIKDSNLNYSQRQALLGQLVKEISNEAITPLVKFKSFKEGWDYVKENDSEGLVIRNDRNWFKIKMKKERFLYFNNYELHTDGKGITLTDGTNRINCGGVEKSRNAIKEIKEKGKVKVEIEFMNYTQDGKMFQPFVRRVVKMGEEKE